MPARTEIEAQVAARRALLRRSAAAVLRRSREACARVHELEVEHARRFGDHPPRWWRWGWCREMQRLEDEVGELLRMSLEEEAGEGYVVVVPVGRAELRAAWAELQQEAG